MMMMMSHPQGVEPLSSYLKTSYNVSKPDRKIWVNIFYVIFMRHAWQCLFPSISEHQGTKGYSNNIDKGSTLPTLPSIYYKRKKWWKRWQCVFATPIVLVMISIPCLCFVPSMFTQFYSLLVLFLISCPCHHKC